MKKRRYYPLGHHSDIKIGFGTVDTTNVKSVYLSFSGWVNLKEEDNEISKKVSTLKKDIKRFVFGLDNSFLKKECIVDIDVSLKSLATSKKTYMETEITVFIKDHISLKDNHKFFNDLTTTIVVDYIYKNSPFNFYKSKT